jgi:hypothetical protein
LAVTVIPAQSFERLVSPHIRDASGSHRSDRLYGIALAHAICPSKPTDFAISR